jgi:hypothetical protein
MALKLIPPIMSKKTSNPDTKSAEPTATVTLTVHLRPGLQIDELAALQRMAHEQGVPIEALIVRGISEFLAGESQPVAA